MQSLRRPVRLLFVWLIIWGSPSALADSEPFFGPQQVPQSRLPLERLATGFHALAGLAWGPDQALYATDRAAGVVYRITPADPGTAQVTVRQAGLHRPHGIAWTPEGTLLVVEAGNDHAPSAGRVLAVNGRPTPIWTGLREPGWLAVGPDGTLYLTAEGLDAPAGGRQGWRPSDAALLLRRAPGAAPEVLATDLVAPGGLVVEADGRLLVSVERLRHQGEWRGPTLVRLAPSVPPEAADRLTVVLGAGFLHPAGLAVDALGGIGFGAESTAWLRAAATHWRAGLERLRGALFRLPPGGWPIPLVAGLEVRALAFDGQGHLYLATDATLYRLRAPAPPVLAPLPPFTNQTTLTVRGTAAPGTTITLRDAGDPVGVPTDATTGAFDGTLPLLPNHAHQIRVTATSLAGAGLPSAPTEAPVLVDTRPPIVHVTSPAPGALVRGIVPLAATAVEPMEADEAWSGLTTLRLTRDGQLVVQGTNPTPESPLPYRIAADWPSPQGPDGPVTLTAFGQDRAGNTTSDTVTMVVDNTPPTVTLAGLPADGILRGSTEVTVSATDLTAGVASVSLFLDGTLQATGASPLLRYTFNPQGLTGAHVVAATAVDRAGNAATVSRPITIQSLAVQLTTPAAGATVPAGPLLVRGTVAAGGQEVGVTVNGVPAMVQGGQWAVELQVPAGTVILEATAYGAGGTTATASVTVQVAEASAPRLLLLATPESGVTPLPVRWQVRNQTGAALVQIELDALGTGSFGAPLPTLEGVQTTYTAPGLVSPQVRATDAQGQPYTASTTLNVLDRQQMDTLLQGKWTGMKAALQQGDIEGALSYFAPNQQVRYRAIFNALATELPGIAAAMQETELVEVLGPQAQYRIRRMQEWGGQQVEVSYYIFFVRGADGLWRISEF